MSEIYNLYTHKIIKLMLFFRQKFIFKCIDIYNYIKNDKVFSGCLLFYILVNTILYLHCNVMVFDEAWFISSFSSKDFTNHLGYGWLYWFFLDFIRYKIILRLIALLAMLSIPFSLHRIATKLNIDNLRYKLVVLLWLTFPASWWYGKLIGPELYCLALGFGGLSLAFPPDKAMKNKICGIVMMGVAAGVKITFIVFPFFYYIYIGLNLLENYNYTKSRHIFTQDLRLSFFLIFGFLLGSPDIIVKPCGYFKNLLHFSSPCWNFSNIKYLFTLSANSSWEGIALPSLASFSISIPAIIFFVGLYPLWKNENKKIVISFIFSFLISVLLVVKSSVFYSWYFYPIIILALVFLINIKLQKKYFIMVILLNMLVNSPIIIIQIGTKVLSIFDDYNMKQIESFVDNYKYKFMQKYKNTEQYISLRAENGSGIIILNELMLEKKFFEKPTFIAVSERMMVAYRDSRSIYNLFYELFSNNKVEKFKNELLALNKDLYETKFIDGYKNVYVFTVIPKGIG